MYHCRYNMKINNANKLLTLNAQIPVCTHRACVCAQVRVYE